jgi:glycosyltransferase involved in cell wall biosynthesis
MIKSKVHYTKNNNFIFIPMSYGISFNIWRKMGLINRELAYFKKISDKFCDVKFNTYDNNIDEIILLTSHIPSGKIIYQKNRFWDKIKFGDLISSFISPFFNIHKFKKCILVRSAQTSGAISGLIIARIIKVPFILRSGYLLSEFTVKKNKRKVLVYFTNWVEKKLVLNSSHIIVTYEKIRQFYHSEYGYKLENITVLGNSIDTRLFSKKETSKDKCLLNIARFTNQKNQKNLIRAASNLNLPLTMIGNGEIEEDLKDLVRELNADVTFLKNIPNIKIPELMSQYKVFILPSYFEGNPKALLEAMSCEMTCLVSDIEEHTSIIQDGINGYICDTTQEEIENKLTFIFESKANINDIGCRARETILKQYSINKNIDREIEIYKKLLEKNEK